MIYFKISRASLLQLKHLYFSLGLVLSLVYVVLTSTVTNSKIYLKNEIINYFDIFTAQIFFFMRANGVLRVRLRQKTISFLSFCFSRDNVCLRRCLRAAAAEGRSRPTT